MARPCWFRLLRGGSWNYRSWDCRSAYRSPDQPDAALSDVGFRVVCPDPAGGHAVPLEDPMADSRPQCVRGGSWFIHPWVCRSAYRGHDQPDGAGEDVGFRVVCPLPGDHTLPLKEPHD